MKKFSFLVLLVLVASVSLVSAGTATITCADGSAYGDSAIDATDPYHIKFYEREDKVKGEKCILDVYDNDNPSITNLLNIDFEVKKGETSIHVSYPNKGENDKISGLVYTEIDAGVELDFTNEGVVFTLPKGHSIKPEYAVIESEKGTVEVLVDTKNAVPGPEESVTTVAGEMYSTYSKRVGKEKIPVITFDSQDVAVRLGHDNKHFGHGMVINGYMLSSAFYNDVVRKVGNNLVITMNEANDLGECDSMSLTLDISFDPESWKEKGLYWSYNEETYDSRIGDNKNVALCDFKIEVLNKNGEVYEDYVKFVSNQDDIKFIYQFYEFAQQDKSFFPSLRLNNGDEVEIGIKEDDSVKGTINVAGSESAYGVTMACDLSFYNNDLGNVADKGTSAVFVLENGVDSGQDEGTLGTSCSYESCTYYGRSDATTSGGVNCGKIDTYISFEDFSGVKGLNFEKGVWSCLEDRCLGKGIFNDNLVKLFPVSEAYNIILDPKRFTSYTVSNGEKTLIAEQYYVGDKDGTEKYKIVPGDGKTTLQQGSLITEFATGGLFYDLATNRKVEMVGGEFSAKFELTPRGEVNLALLDCCQTGREIVSNSEADLTSEIVPTYGCQVKKDKNKFFSRDNEKRYEKYQPVPGTSNCKIRDAPVTQEALTSDDGASTVKVAEEGEAGAVVEEAVEEATSKKGNACKTSKEGWTCSCAYDQYFEGGMSVEDCKNDNDCQTNECLGVDKPFFCCQNSDATDGVELKSKYADKYGAFASALGYGTSVADVRRPTVTPVEEVRDEDNKVEETEPAVVDDNNQKYYYIADYTGNFYEADLFGAPYGTGFQYCGVEEYDFYLETDEIRDDNIQFYNQAFESAGFRIDTKDGSIKVAKKNIDDLNQLRAATNDASIDYTYFKIPKANNQCKVKINGFDIDWGANSADLHVVCEGQFMNPMPTGCDKSHFVSVGSVSGIIKGFSEAYVNIYTAEKTDESSQDIA